MDDSLSKLVTKISNEWMPRNGIVYILYERYAIVIISDNLVIYTKDYYVLFTRLDVIYYERKSEQPISALSKQPIDCWRSLINRLYNHFDDARLMVGGLSNVKKIFEMLDNFIQC